MSLRLRLRQDTRAAHERLDVIAGALNLARRADYVRFLSAHASAYDVLRHADRDTSALMYQRMRAAQADLAVLGADAQETQPNLSVDPCIEPIGLSYVILGSHLGARQIVKQVTASSPTRHCLRLRRCSAMTA